MISSSLGRAVSITAREGYWRGTRGEGGRADALMTRLRHLWAAMDHPDGKKGLAFAPFGETIVLFRGLSPKQATCVLLLLGSTAFWMGTALGLGIFFLLFDVDAEAKQRVMHAARVGMAAMYILVLVACARLFFSGQRSRSHAA